jgi:hypothetical protein
MTWHTVLSGKEECRKSGAWDLTICQSKERALDQAHALLRYGYIVYAIQASGKTIMDEEQIREKFPLTQSKQPTTGKGTLANGVPASACSTALRAI